MAMLPVSRRWARIAPICCVVVLGMMAVYAAESNPVSTARETQNTTALDRYVAAPDPNYTFELVNTFEQPESTGYVLKMVSQQWRTAAEVDRPIWEHWLTICVPKKVKSETALIMIGGGSNKPEAPKGGDVKLHKIASNTNAIMAEIGQIPNEPLTFSDDNKRRTEDSIIAYTWDKYMRTGDETWPLRLPMTKAVVRAMDTIQTFCATKDAGKHTIKNFVVTGGSKRGWTTWTTAAVDNRVIAIAPAVIDCLNVVPSFRHHRAVYGGWAEAIGDYEEMKAMDWLETPEFASLMGIVDPYSYRDRYATMPKLLLNSCGDQFFLPDSAQFYVNDLKGPLYFRYIPNTGHPLNASAYVTVEAYFHSIITNTPLPQYAWSFPDAGTIRVETSTKPQSVKLWQATNPDARDFRIDKIGPAYKPADVPEESKGVYVAKVAQPEKGWTAFLVELVWKGVGEAPITFTTPVRIIPDTTPSEYKPVESPAKGFLSK